MDTSKALVTPVLLLLVAACGAPTEPAKTPEPASSAPAAPTAAAAEAPEKTEAAPPAASAAPAPAEGAPPAAAGGSGLTKAALDEANKIVGDAYPGPFEKTYKSVVAKLGEPKKKSDNMYEWFAMDGGKCIMFFVTKDSKKGHAASGRAETDASECK